MLAPPWVGCGPLYSEHVNPAWWKRWGVRVGALAGALALVAVVVVVVLLQHLVAVPPSALVSTSVPGDAQVLAPSAARQLEAELSSGEASRIRKALVIPAGEKLSSSFFKDLASLGRISIREDSAVSLDDTSTRVYADVEHGQVKTWTLLLIEVDGQWRVASTIEEERK